MPAVDLIAHRSRLALARRLAEAPNSSASDLAAATGLHLNTVRAHLHALEASGTVERASERSGRPGRPVVRYRLRRTFIPAGDELLPLAGLLAETLIDLRPAAKRIRGVGLEWGRRWSRRSAVEAPEQRLRPPLERLGFAVELADRRLELTACPCPLVSRTQPQMICQLVDAVIDGLLEGTRERAERWDHQPAQRRCTATLTGT